MKKSEIQVGGLYTARISGRFVTVRVDTISDGGSTARTRYDVTNLDTRRKTVFHSAAKFRGEVKAASEGASEGADPTCAPSVAGVESLATTETGAERLSTVQTQGDSLPPASEGEQGSDPILQQTGTDGVIAAGNVEPFVDSRLGSGGASVAAAGANASFASALAAMPKAPKLTAEQEAILATAREVEAARTNGQRVLVIGAGAGTGKTFTLKQLEQVLQGNGQYTAFNSSLVAESKGKFKRAACNTTHSLAFRATGKQFAHRLNGARVKSWEVAQRLGIGDFTFSGTPYPEDSYEYAEAAINAGYGSDNPPPDDFQPAPVKRLKASYLAGQVIAAIRRFCQSDEPEISVRSFRRFEVDEPGETKNSDAVREYLLPFAVKAWADLSDPQGSTMPFSHDCYVKLWELGRGEDRPVIAADYILLDEYQDTAPVMVSILRQQEHALIVLVGDDNQRIYEWRGAVNAGDYFPGAPRRLLSQSFRFGQTVADVANAVLGTLQEPTDLVMKGMPTIPTRVCPVVEPRCYLYRTNAGTIQKLMEVTAAGKRGFLIGGSKETQDFCQAAIDLQAKRGTTHPELGCFETWDEVVKYSKEDEGADLRLMVKLIDDFGAAEILSSLKKMPEKEEQADVVMSTAHRSKGREWASVQLGPDFPTANKLTDADRRLIYVAATRAQEELDVSKCPTFCGGYDKLGGGEDGGNGAKWIPGIEIAYTVPMPSEVDLATYRAAKNASKASQTVTVPATAPKSVPGLVASPRPAQAPANGKPAGTATYTKLRDGSWGIRAEGFVPKTGELVTVVKKSGERKTERVEKVLWTGNGVTLATIT